MLKFSKEEVADLLKALIEWEAKLDRMKPYRTQKNDLKPYRRLIRKLANYRRTLVTRRRRRSKGASV
jgi:hypothetical protein